MQLHTQADGMKPKIITVLIVIMLAFECFMIFNFVEESKADVLPKFYVDNDYDSTTPGWLVDHFNKIQEAIDNSSTGDRIVVYAGTYSESLTISHKIDLFGEDKTLVTITGSDTGDRITISAEYVNISHFTIQNCGTGTYNAVIIINSRNAIITDNIIQSGGKHGIYINNSDYQIIYDNSITSNGGNGIYFNHSDYNSITYNSITSNSNNGIFLYNSSNNTIQYNSAVQSNSYNGIFLNETSNYNTISNNNFTSNTKNGIFLNDHCNNNTISTNDIYSNSDTGIRIENSSYNTLSSNIVNKNTDYGILLVGSNSTINSNNIYNNGIHGIYLFADNNNLVYSNTIRNNTYDGIRISNSTSDSIYSNAIYGNTKYGMNLDYFTLNNLIYNNIFYENIENNSLDKSLNQNRWNATKTLNTNKIGGPYICGNYWDDFDEAIEGAIDTDGDDISNYNRTINISSSDNGPILDINPPSVSNPSLSSGSQTIGGYIRISCTVTDDIKVKNVYLIITNPRGVTTNSSIFSNKTGDVYSSYDQYTIAGTYNLYIGAKDSRKWTSSSNGSFYIDLGSAPTITDNTPTTAAPSTTFIINATVIDDTDRYPYLNVTVYWSQGSNTYSGNYSMNNVYGNFFEMYAVLGNTTNEMTYTIFAKDRWGNSRTATTKTVRIVDTLEPTISINRYGSSSDDLPNSYTFGATIRDNNEVKNVNIEYWYEDNDHITVSMDKKTNTYYEKVIVFNDNPSRVYSIIYATDPSGNVNNTKNPFANASGPYIGTIGVGLTFNASNSFDLDGDISTYSWIFGDGTTGTGVTTSHIYSSNGNYTINLTVTDNNGNTNTVSTYALIISLVKQTVDSTTLSEIEANYNVTLDESFYCYDTDGDSIVDKFIDPNNVLKNVRSGSINISGNYVFLLSIDDETIPEFMWNTTTDEIININHTTGTTDEPDIDIINKIAVTNVIINKTDGWIYLEVEEPNLGNTKTISNLLYVKKNNTIIEDYKIYRKSGKTYILDDPDTTYEFTFSYVNAQLQLVSIHPDNGELINQENPTITFTLNVAGFITNAIFYDQNSTVELDIIDDIITNDDITFTYTPPNNLAPGLYYIEIDVEDEDGTPLYISKNYQYQPYEQQEAKFPLFTFLTIFGGIGLAGLVILLFIRFKIITLESFIYIKNKKIIPFFKPFVFGPLRIDVNDKKVRKAEFYVNGKLKDTLTQEPFIWNWDEPAFMKKTIETKVYDEYGNSTSSGEMTFFVFNTPKFFK